MAVALTASVGCSEDYFTNKPQDSLDPSKLGVDQVEGLLNSVYGNIGSAYNTFQDAFADNGFTRNFWDGKGKKVQTNTVGADVEFEGDDFGYANSYSGVRNCNLLLESIDNIKGVADNIKKSYKAQTRVIRAFIYMKLNLSFGDVPLITSVKNDFGKEGVPQTPSAEIRKWVLKEIDEATADLSSEKTPGRITKSVAYAIKARAAYYFGEYAQARDAARWVIDNGGYALAKSDFAGDAGLSKDAAFFEKMVDFDAYGINKEAFLKGVFNYESTFCTDNNSEVILAKEYLPTEEYGDWQRVTSFMTPNMTGMQAWNTMAPIQDLVDAYWSIDGKSKPQLASVSYRQGAYKALMDQVAAIKASQKVDYNDAVKTIADQLPSKDYLKQFRNRDSRLYASIVFPFAAINKYRDGFYQQYDHTQNNFGETGFAWRKLASLKDVGTLWGGEYYTSGLDFPLIRLAEMLLIYAEAQTQLAGYDGSVVTELNKLRERCGMPNVPIGLSKPDALDFIRKERRIELAGEGLRFYDIRLYEDNTRNGGYKGEEAASNVMKGDISDPVTKRSTKVWASRLMLLPFPTTALDRNSALIQNKGY